MKSPKKKWKQSAKKYFAAERLGTHQKQNEGGGYNVESTSSEEKQHVTALHVEKERKTTAKRMNRKLPNPERECLRSKMVWL